MQIKVENFLSTERVTLGKDSGYPSTIRLKNGWLVTAFYSTIGEKADLWSSQEAKSHLLVYREEELLQAIQK